MFSNLGDPNQRRNKHGWRPPPNYYSRPVRIRLFVLVFMVMMVLVAMSRVSDPEFWSFMGFKDEKQTPSSKNPVDDRVDSRPRTAAEPQRAQDAFSTSGDQQPDENDRELVPPGGEFDYMVQDGWQHVHAKLDDHQRALLHLVLKQAREGSALPDDKLQRWNELSAKLDDSWKQFILVNENALAKPADAASDEKQTWEQTLARIERYWKQEVQPALALAAIGKPLSTEQSASLEQTQQHLDTIALKQVRDNTHLARYKEKNAWFRLFDRLNTTSQDQLTKHSSGHVGFLQLFRQPKQYRGKLVTIRGTARLAYHVQAPPNIYGIKGYYVFWVVPHGMTDQLINVYSLETPPGFPEIKDKDLDKEKTKLIEDVEFTGYFFKNYSYRTETGSNLAPLVLAKVPSWEPPAKSRFEMPQTSYILLAVAAIALVAIGISVLAYVRSRNTSSVVSGYSVSARGKTSQIKELEKEEVVDIGERLRELADSESSADSK